MTAVPVGNNEEEEDDDEENVAGTPPPFPTVVVSRFEARTPLSPLRISGRVVVRECIAAAAAAADVAGVVTLTAKVASKGHRGMCAEPEKLPAGAPVTFAAPVSFEYVAGGNLRPAAAATAVAARLPTWSNRLPKPDVGNSGAPSPSSATTIDALVLFAASNPDALISSTYLSHYSHLLSCG